jgi:cysteine desulfurase
MESAKNYFDYAAATPLLPEVLVSMEPYLKDKFYNASGLYLGAKTNYQAIVEARHVIARGLGAKPTEIVFTAGGSEANNLAIRGIMESYPSSNMIVSSIEHESVLRPSNLFATKTVKVDKQGVVKLDDLKSKIDKKTVLVSIMYANNEIGSIQPIRKIAKLIKEIRQSRESKGNQTPIYLHSDACQAGNFLDMQVFKLGVDLLTINSGKIYGPKQCGALYVKTGLILKPLIFGGGQEWGLRSGTENIANIVGFATAWQKVRSNYHEEAERLTIIRDNFISKNLTPVVFQLNGPKSTNRLANNIHITIDGKDNEIMAMVLDEKGFQVAIGSACSASSEEPSHVLKAIGLTDEQARSSLRITLGFYTTDKSLENLGKTLNKLVAPN